VRLEWKRFLQSNSEHPIIEAPKPNLVFLPHPLAAVPKIILFIRASANPRSWPVQNTLKSEKKACQPVALPLDRKFERQTTLFGRSKKVQKK
jgi:hypothetical protein